VRTRGPARVLLPVLRRCWSIPRLAY